jgi:dihydroflavonol-4-reductase
MKIAVTGAGGHVGGNCVRALMEKGHEVRALLHRDAAAVEPLDVEKADIELEDYDSLVKAFSGADQVYHAAAFISLSGKRDQAILERVNVEGTRNVVRACKACGVQRLVYFSSIHALSAYPLDKPVDESREPSFDSRNLAYDRSKARGEEIVREALNDGLDSVIVNPTAIMGPNDFKPSRQGQLLLDLYHRRMPALIDAGYDWVDVRDVAAGAIAAAERGRSGERYILGGERLMLIDLARMIQDLPGANPPTWVLPLWVAYLGLPFAAIKSWFTGRPAALTTDSLHVVTTHKQISHDKAVHELGYKPRPIARTIEDTFDWFDGQNLLKRGVYERVHAV